MDLLCKKLHRICRKLPYDHPMVHYLADDTDPSEINGERKLLVGPGLGAEYGLDQISDPLMGLIIQWAERRGIDVGYSPEPLPALRDHYVYTKRTALYSITTQTPLPLLDIDYKLTVVSSYKPHGGRRKVAMPSFNDIIEPRFLGIYISLLLGIGVMIGWITARRPDIRAMISTIWTLILGTMMGFQGSQLRGRKRYLPPKYILLGVYFLMNFPVLELIRSGLTSALTYQPQPMVNNLEDALKLCQTNGALTFFWEIQPMLEGIRDSDEQLAATFRELLQAQLPEPEKVPGYERLRLAENHKALLFQSLYGNELMLRQVGKTHSLYIAEQKYLPTLVTWGLVGRNVTHRAAIIQAAKRWHEMGILSMLEYDLSIAYQEGALILMGMDGRNQPAKIDTEDQNIAYLSLAELSAAFIISLSGMMAAIIILIMEKLANKFRGT